MIDEVAAWHAVRERLETATPLWVRHLSPAIQSLLVINHLLAMCIRAAMSGHNRT